MSQTKTKTASADIFDYALWAVEKGIKKFMPESPRKGKILTSMGVYKYAHDIVGLFRKRHGADLIYIIQMDFDTFSLRSGLNGLLWLDL